MKPNAIAKSEPPIIPGDFIWQRVDNNISRWISDLEFFRGEIAFLLRVLTRSYPWTSDNEGMASVTRLIRSLNNLELRRDLFLRIIKYHRTQVQLVILNPFVHDGQSIMQDHRDIEKRLVEFESGFRHKKSKIFQFVEGIVDADKLPNLLDSRYELD